MKLCRSGLLLTLALFAVSCGGGNGGQDLQDSVENEVVSDVIHDTSDTADSSDTTPDARDTIDAVDSAADADGRIDDGGTDDGVTVGDSEPETSDVCECRSNEECADAFDNPGACEKALCDGCECVKSPMADNEPCDDGNVCTDGDKCLDTVCAAGANVCACSTNDNCAVHDNADLCDGSFKCNLTLAVPVCEIDPASISVCEDTLHDPCRTVGCNPQTGECVDIFINENGTCDDGVTCTTGDKCAAGVCSGTPYNSLCDDIDPCTDDSCDINSGCVYMNNDGPCDDGDKCTEDDYCAQGDCLPGPDVICNDDNVCTSELCDPAEGCVYTDVTDTCDDFNACTGVDACLAGACIGTSEICCADESDNDDDDLVDCHDPDCIESDDCPVEIAGCMMMAPGNYTGNEGDSFVANVMIAAAGVTDLTTGYDSHPQIRVQRATGAADTAAEDLPALSWMAAEPDASTFNPTFDYWTGEITIPQITDDSLARDFMFRVSGNKGKTWTYCDLDGSENGYATEQSGKLTIRPPYKLMFSEYVEGSGSFRAIEILNVGPYAASLGDCSVMVYANGLTSTTNVTELSEIDLEEDAVFTVCNDLIPDEVTGHCDMLTPRMSFNGDDAISLVCNEIVQDVIGVIGNRPVDGGWGTGDVYTKDRTIRRSCLVQSGTGRNPDEFAAGEWIGFNMDTWEGLGSRLCSGPCVSNESESCCADEADSDLDGLIDCDDPDCEAVEACQIPVGWCRFAGPDSIRGSVGMPQKVTGWVFVSGMTDATTDNDNPAGLLGQFGYGPDASIPDTSWTWTDAAVAAANTAPRNDADTYSSDFVIPDIPQIFYDTAFRFSADGGYSWTYCDTNGLDDGYTVSMAGSLEVVSSPLVIFTEYASGNDNNKALEIINFSNRSIDLGLCSITIYADGALGASAQFPIAADVMLAADQTWVVCKTGASSELSPHCDNYKSLLDFDGNDTILLTCEGRLMDSFGRRGENPDEDGWGSGDITSAAHTLRRHCDQIAGDTDATDAFDPATEWWSFPQDTFEGLGTIICGSICYQNGMETCCGDDADNDLDGLADCEDPDCSTDPECDLPEVAYAAVEMPYTITFLFGEAPATVNARVNVQGVTEPAGQGVGVKAEAGYGPDGSLPDGPAWKWFTASYTTDLDHLDDRYSAIFSDVPVGVWDFAFRFSTDNGLTWTYADKEMAGSTNGYSTADAGGMTVNVSVETACDDDTDNDGDLLVDCADDDCTLEPQCLAESDCTDSVDNDGDMVTDCDDSDCTLDPACVALPSLIFSEYLEGSLFNKFIEIRNTGSDPLSLDGCTILMYMNGSYEPDGMGIALSGDLNADDVLVVCHTMLSAAHADRCDVFSTSLLFTGDDAVVLMCGGYVIDSIGSVGEYPTNGWIATPGDWSTKDDCLCRSALVQDTVIDDAFNPATQWVHYGNDYFDGMGVTGCAPL